MYHEDVILKLQAVGNYTYHTPQVLQGINSKEKKRGKGKLWIERNIERNLMDNAKL